MIVFLSEIIKDKCIYKKVFLFPSLHPLASIKCQLAIVQIEKKYVLKGFLFFLKTIGEKSVI